MHFLCITCELCPSYSSCEIFLLIWLEQIGYITGLCFKYYHNLISVSDTRVLSCKQAGAQTQKCAHYCDDHTGTNGSPPACAAVKYSMCAVCRCTWLWRACRWCSSHVYFYFLRGKDACSHHAEHINSKLSPPVGCWFWVVPRSMLLEALTCWNCRWFWFWVGDWGWAGLEVWEFSLEQIDEAVTVVGWLSLDK